MCLFVLTKFTNVTYGRGQTDGQTVTAWRYRSRLYIVSRGRNL